jgi:hypothetical protein
MSSRRRTTVALRGAEAFGTRPESERRFAGEEPEKVAPYLWHMRFALLLLFATASCDAILGIDVVDGGEDVAPTSDASAGDTHMTSPGDANSRRDARGMSSRDGGGDAGGAADARRNLDAQDGRARLPDAESDGRPDTAPDAKADVRVDAGAPDAVTCPTPPDCSNPACVNAGYSCVALPSGWTLASADFGGSSACPTGYGDSQSLVEAPDAAPASCSCSAQVTADPSCVTGTFTTLVGPSGCTMNAPVSANNGQCYMLSSPLTTYEYTSVEPLAPTGGTCTGTVETDKPGYTAPTVNVCTDPSPSGAGCPSGHACVAPAGRSVCLVETSDAGACPSGFSSKHTVGSVLEDERECSGACTYGAPTATCTGAKLSYFHDPGCTDLVLTLDANGACDMTGIAQTESFISLLYSATVTSPTCGAPTDKPTAAGSVVLEDTQTVCCQ